MLAIGIESSCDDTAVAVLNGKGVVLSSLVSSQIKIHEKHHKKHDADSAIGIILNNYCPN